MIWLFFIPFFLQTAIIFFDEFYFHLKRGLPRWERVGHPLDTLSVLICFLFVLIFPYSTSMCIVYIILSLFSAIFVTKDEFVHKECCPASEQWLHALLFINHPIVLFALGSLWPLYHALEVPSFLIAYQQHSKLIGIFLWGQASAIFLFGLYQWVYWNIIRCNETN